MKIPAVRIAAMVLLAVSSITARCAYAAEEETEAVRAAAEGFYSALNSMFTGESGPMKKVWSHADDVTYMGPDGGFHVGWKQVLADWEKQAALKLGGKVEPKQMRITVGRDLAIVSNLEHGENVSPDGKVERVRIRATNLFRKKNGSWKMIGHHTDLLPFLK